MTVKELFVADLQATLEETASIMADRLILESLAKSGNITLEEAEFYDSLVRRVITEAAEEFVPDRLDVAKYLSEGEGMKTLTDEDGVVYTFNQATCELVPVEGTGGADNNPSVDDMGEGAGIEEPVLGESTEIGGGAQELTESQMIVSNLIKSIGA
jgi:uncharacterized protein YerC